MCVGRDFQLTVNDNNVSWVSENPNIAEISSTGLVKAKSIGTTSVYAVTVPGEKAVCNVSILPKRNILFFVATDSSDGIDSDSRPKINLIRQGWSPLLGEMLIYADRNGRDACLMRINNVLDSAGYYGLDTLDVYGMENSADSAVLSRSLDELFSIPGDSYGLIHFSHGSGWLPEGTLSRPRSVIIDNGGAKREMEYYEYAAAIPDDKLDFIVFEACLMADVAVMYELRNKAGYVLASSAEIISPGFGGSNGLTTTIYKDKIMSLYNTSISIASALTEFGQSYYDYIATIPETNDYCSVTLSLIKMNEMEALSNATKNTLQGKVVGEDNLSVSIDDIQSFDRPSALISSSYVRKSRYFDLTNTIENISSVTNLSAFKSQVDKTVVWKASTKNFFLGGSGFYINYHSGLTIYIQQDVYPYLNSFYSDSEWSKAISGQ
jgi:hypothetical protein